MNFKKKKTLVFGLGRSGLAAVRVLSRLKAEISVYDERPLSKLKPLLRRLPKQVKLISKPKAHDFQLVIVSPGVPWDHSILKTARKANVPVWPELELGWRLVRPFRTIGVTGTNGKTTTTALLGTIFKKAGKKVVVGGNIGRPLCDLISRIDKKTYLILEVSSYQLEGVDTFHPNVGIFLNLTPDHLKRHRTMANYAKMKGRMFKNASGRDVAVLNRNDRWCRQIGKTVRAQKKWFPDKKLKSLLALSPLSGRHNQENVSAAILAAQAAGLTVLKIKSGIKSFKGVEHRLELVTRKKGVLYINDSKSTNVDSTLVALQAADRPTFLILGGEHKGSSYRPLSALLRSRVKQVFAIGSAQNQIARELENVVPVSKMTTMERAVRQASKVSQRGDQVLLSPACASFDQYANFEERGRHFKSLVRSI